MRHKFINERHRIPTLPLSDQISFWNMIRVKYLCEPPTRRFLPPIPTLSGPSNDHPKQLKSVPYCSPLENSRHIFTGKTEVRILAVRWLWARGSFWKIRAASLFEPVTDLDQSAGRNVSWAWRNQIQTQLVLPKRASVWDKSLEVKMCSSRRLLRPGPEKAVCYLVNSVLYSGLTSDRQLFLVPLAS